MAPIQDKGFEWRLFRRRGHRVVGVGKSAHLFARLRIGEMIGHSTAFLSMLPPAVGPRIHLVGSKSWREAWGNVGKLPVKVRHLSEERLGVGIPCTPGAVLKI